MQHPWSSLDRQCTSGGAIELNVRPPSRCSKDAAPQSLPARFSCGAGQLGVLIAAQGASNGRTLPESLFVPWRRRRRRRSPQARTSSARKERSGPSATEPGARDPDVVSRNPREGEVPRTCVSARQRPGVPWQDPHARLEPRTGEMKLRTSVTLTKMSTVDVGKRH